MQFTKILFPSSLILLLSLECLAAQTNSGHKALGKESNLFGSAKTKLHKPAEETCDGCNQITLINKAPGSKRRGGGDPFSNIAVPLVKRRAVNHPARKAPSTQVDFSNRHSQHLDHNNENDNQNRGGKGNDPMSKAVEASLTLQRRGPPPSRKHSAAKDRPCDGCILQPTIPKGLLPPPIYRRAAIDTTPNALSSRAPKDHHDAKRSGKSNKQEPKAMQTARPPGGTLLSGPGVPRPPSRFSPQRPRTPDGLAGPGPQSKGDVPHPKRSAAANADADAAEMMDLTPNALSSRAPKDNHHAKTPGKSDKQDSPARKLQAPPSGGLFSPLPGLGTPLNPKMTIPKGLGSASGGKPKYSKRSAAAASADADAAEMFGILS